jgi:hypothetical protein
VEGQVRGLGRRGHTLAELLIFVFVSFVVLEALVQLTTLALRDEARETRAAGPALAALMTSKVLTRSVGRATALVAPAPGTKGPRVEGYIGVHMDPDGAPRLPAGAKNYERFVVCLDQESRLLLYETVEAAHSPPHIDCGDKDPAPVVLVGGRLAASGGFIRPEKQANVVQTALSIGSEAAGQDGRFRVDLLTAAQLPIGSEAAP